MRSAGLTFALSVSFFPIIAATSPSAQIRINLYNDANLSDRSLQIATAEANRILLAADVRAMWATCRIHLEAGASCTAPGPATLYVRIYSKAADVRYKGNAKALGFSIPQPAPDYGFYAGVFYKEIQVLASRNGINPSVLLGHVLAHELGHLLLGQGGHGRKGLMQDHWYVDALVRLKQGILFFQPHEKKTIRANLLARLSLQASQARSRPQFAGTRLP